MDRQRQTDDWEFASLSAAAVNQHGWWSTPAQVDVEGLSHTGNVRPTNEDHFIVTRYGRFFEDLQSNLPAEDIPRRHELSGYALLVADGLGGHAAGETASRLAIQILCNLVVDTPDWIFRVEDERFAAEVQRRMTERLEQVNYAMTKQAELDSDLRGFGTTLTVAWGIGKNWFIAHLGDSRAYLFRQGELRQLTHDHTAAQELADRGIIEQQKVQFHRWRNRLTRLLGDQVENATPEILPLAIEDNDCLLVCSDGLTDMVSQENIADVLASGRPSGECCHQLIASALDAGGKDNITAVVARIRLAPPNQE